MAIRIPTINAGVGWYPATSSSAAEIYSLIQVKPNAGRTVIRYYEGNPSDSETVLVDTGNPGPRDPESLRHA